MHYFINHKLEFVSQMTKEIHTNTIENLWKLVKKDLRRTNTTSKNSWINKILLPQNLNFERTTELLLHGLEKS